VVDKLIEGIHKFMHDVVDAEYDFYEGLAKGQHPSTYFVTCADSRVDPNLITQTKPGDLFVSRNAGNIIPPYFKDNPMPSGEAATLSYAVEVLKVEHIIVCGHSHCGAMAALGNREELDKLPDISRWLDFAQETLDLMEEAHLKVDMEDPSLEQVQINVLVQLRHVASYPAVQKAEEENRLTLHGWVYEIENGAVWSFDPHRKIWLKL
jgi:carbonic anhydrase